LARRLFRCLHSEFTNLARYLFHLHQAHRFRNLTRRLFRCLHSEFTNLARYLFHLHQAHRFRNLTRRLFRCLHSEYTNVARYLFPPASGIKCAVRRIKHADGLLSQTSRDVW